MNIKFRRISRQIICLIIKMVIMSEKLNKGKTHGISRYSCLSNNAESAICLF